MKSKPPLRILLSAFLLILIWTLPYQDVFPMDHLVLEKRSMNYPISSPYYPVVLSGKSLPFLLNVPIDKISVHAAREGLLQPIPFQIDRRDKRGMFQIPGTTTETFATEAFTLDENDECVFMSGDLGEKLEPFPENIDIAGATQLEIQDPVTKEKKWIYLLVHGEEAPEKTSKDYIRYHAYRDAIESDVYRIAFSRKSLFLIDTLQWKDAHSQQNSPNLTDTMKVRHRGKLFHQFNFLRTQSDNKSTLLGVKDGPVRVIRRTQNKVRIILKLRSPSIHIDYICYPNAFFMDTLIDIPFRIGWFFSNVDTLMTIDGNDDPSLPTFKVFTRSNKEGVIVDGKMSEEEKDLSSSGDKDMVISSPFGQILVALDIAKDFPIRQQIYYVDDQSKPDPPENISGQYGNGGFLTTGWENLGNDIYHMMFRVYMIQDISVDQGFEILKHSPTFAN